MKDTIKILMFTRNGWLIRVIGDIAVIATDDIVPSREIKIRSHKSAGKLMVLAGGRISNYIDQCPRGKYKDRKDEIIEMTLKEIVIFHYSDLMI